MPTHSSSTPPSNAADRIAFLARVSLVCPFLVVLLALIGARLENRLVADIGAIALAFIGLLCGIAALIRGRQSAGASVAVQGGIGLLISLVFVGIVLNNYLQSQSSTPSESAQSGTAAQRLSEALAQFVVRTTELEQRLVAAAKPLADSPVLNLAGVQSTDSLDSRRTQVEAFLEASGALSNHLAQAQSFIEARLTARGASADEARTNSAGFLDNLQPKILVSYQIREIEHQYSQTLMEALRLLTSQWGKWMSTAEGTPRFDDDAATRQYAELLNRLSALETRDLELKQKLANP
jgi:hypothetical protein